MNVSNMAETENEQQTSISWKTRQKTTVVSDRSNERSINRWVKCFCSHIFNTFLFRWTIQEKLVSIWMESMVGLFNKWIQTTKTTWYSIHAFVFRVNCFTFDQAGAFGVLNGRTRPICTHAAGSMKWRYYSTKFPYRCNWMPNQR